MQVCTYGSIYCISLTRHYPRTVVAQLGAPSEIHYKHRPWIVAMASVCSTRTHVPIILLLMLTELSLVPRPPCFFSSLVCVQYNTRKRKSAKNREGLGIPITWMTSGGRRGGEGPHSNTWTNYFIIERALYHQARPQTFTRSWVLRLTGKKHALRFIASILLIGHCPLPPPTSTSRPPDVIHMIGVPRPRFSRSSASMYYTERKPKNKKRGRPGNEATLSYL